VTPGKSEYKIMEYKSTFTTSSTLANAHLQTLWGPFIRQFQPLTIIDEMVTLPDQDVLELNRLPNPSGPIVLILSGLGGSIESHYVKGLLLTLQANGFTGIFMHHRGTGKEPNQSLSSYHLGHTLDLRYIVELIAKRYPGKPLFLVGYSLGGNIVLNYLAERFLHNTIQAAVAISIPFNPKVTVGWINHGIGKIYQRYLLKSLKRDILRKGSQMSLPLSCDEINRITTLNDWDERITAPLHGFLHAEDYYHQSDCRHALKIIKTPTLILHSTDDPLIPVDVIPAEKDLSSTITLELSQHGGHVGFIGGRLLEPHYWLEKRILTYVSSFF